jgi:hypothetical protein
MNGAAGRPTGTGSTATGEAGAYQKELRAAREETLRLNREMTAMTGRIAESIRHAQEQLTAIVRQAKEARRDVEELRELARDAHREGLGEPPAGDRAGAADGGHGSRAAPRAEPRGKKAPARGRATNRPAVPETRNRLGVTVGSGVVVAEVQDNSPAEEAGLKKGDVIEEVNGTPIVSAAQLRDAIRQAGDDANITLRVVRAGEPEEVKAKAGKRGEESDKNGGRNQLGVTVGPGVVVAEVLPDTPASKARVERGDVIDAVNGTPVLSGEQLRDVVQRVAGGTQVVLHITRVGKSKEVRATLDAAPNGG